jgi:WD40 repeat protein
MVLRISKRSRKLRPETAALICLPCGQDMLTFCAFSSYSIEHGNSVDGVQVNPTNSREFCTVSHDKTIKIWDSARFTVSTTMTGHEQGVWSISYDAKNGNRIATTSPDTMVKLWDLKSGKCSATLKGHKGFCYRAVFDGDGTNLASVGADKVLNYWDARNTAKPVFSIKDFKNVLMSVDFMPNGQQILVTSMEGEIMQVSVKRECINFTHDTLPAILEEKKDNFLMSRSEGDQNADAELEGILKNTSNILYSCLAVKGDPEYEGHYLVGDEMGNVGKFKSDYGTESQLDTFSGHSMGIRSMEVQKGKLLTGCMDHSIRIWDYDTCKATTILAGHHDVVVSLFFANSDLFLSLDWRDHVGRSNPYQ